ncbi:MFS transporter [Macrococcus bovicus]|uniref:MFS transporter n=1 Tax=Macrococcus bovicus TaxID=69968 RepID=UPI0025A612E7|nr:MFS transporter [Macrococcus bovicus]WJP96757.1 MFS transporter [Macrococcus bovicus]
MNSFYKFNSDFRNLIIASFFSKFGIAIYTLALPLIVYKLSKSGTLMAVTFVIEFLPHIIFSLFGGAFADRLSKRKIMIYGDITSFFAVIIILVTSIYGIINVPIILTATFILSSASAFYHPSFESVIPEMLPESELVKGNSVFRLIETITTLIGPSIGGILIGLLGDTEVLLITAVTFFFSFISIFLIKGSYVNEDKSDDEKILNSIMIGLKYVAENKIILSGTIFMFLINISYGMIESLFIFFLKHNLNYSASYIGYVFSFQTLGSIIALYIVNKFKDYRRGKFIIISAIVMTLGMLLLCFSHNLILIILARMIMIGSVTGMAVSWFTLRQEIVPSKLLGRVISSTRMVAYLSLPLSGMISGALINYTDIQMIYITSTIFTFILSIIFLNTKFIKS